LIFLLLQLGLLVFDDVDEQLILKTFGRDSEIDDCDLDADLGKIVRIGKLGRDDEFEIIIVRNGGVTKPDHLLATLLEDVLLQDWLQ
jgi:hypothetical protein